MNTQQDALVIVSQPAAFDRVLQRLRQVATVTQMLPPRLILIGLPPNGWPSFRSIEGATVFVDTPPPPEVHESLTPVEQQFVAAWLARGQDKVRPGDGLSWDAPGFLPPDKPASTPNE